MIQKLQEARRNQDGFSLVELLIVIVVLGVLAGIVVFGVGTFRSDAAQSACTAEAKTVKVAASAYLARNGGTIEGEDSKAVMQTLVKAGYLESVPSNAEYISVNGKGQVTDKCSDLGSDG